MRGCDRRPPLDIRKVACLSAFLALMLLPACNLDEDAAPPATTGRESTFELSGDVTAVDIEDVDFDVSVPPEGANVDVDAAITVNLTVNIETIDDASSELCGLEVGQDVVVVVTDETDLDFNRPLSELGTLEDESVRASGAARETAAVQSPGQATVEPGGNCEFSARTLSLVEEASPAATVSPIPSPLN